MDQNTADELSAGLYIVSTAGLILAEAVLLIGAPYSALFVGSWVCLAIAWVVEKLYGSDYYPANLKMFNIVWTSTIAVLIGGFFSKPVMVLGLIMFSGALLYERLQVVEW